MDSLVKSPASLGTGDFDFTYGKTKGNIKIQEHFINKGYEAGDWWYNKGYQ